MKPCKISSILATTEPYLQSYTTEPSLLYPRLWRSSQVVAASDLRAATGRRDSLQKIRSNMIKPWEISQILLVWYLMAIVSVQYQYVSINVRALVLKILHYILLLCESHAASTLKAEENMCKVRKCMIRLLTNFWTYSKFLSIHYLWGERCLYLHLILSLPSTKIGFIWHICFTVPKWTRRVPPPTTCF